jgi:hypothetical protein
MVARVARVPGAARGPAKLRRFACAVSPQPVERGQRGGAKTSSVAALAAQACARTGPPPRRSAAMSCCRPRGSCPAAASPCRLSGRLSVGGIARPERKRRWCRRHPAHTLDDQVASAALPRSARTTKRQSL